ncbi:DEAD/DEAH box helicase [Paenibacillus swuensis]|uniref:DEAD/DEAH box helicase n=1 Tax=Paenibacillus swuensis TaxID=1178515 RepID=A0A172TGR8_9BACL|nr:DEAD/DEAH box helicase [Paenibacillus swuensis]ANE46136.1 DEAD/DEAH box helicase [Paenibacillus swuensis]
MTTTTTFGSLNVKDDYVRILEEQDIVQPSYIQEQAIPAVAAGKDVVAQSQTGTGKTLAYLLPLLQRIDPSLKQLQGVILVPTRELGMQILREIEMLHPDQSILGQALIGGVSLQRQIEKLRLHPQLIVGTPGRVLELIKTRKLKMHGVKTIVVDEVDQVFDLGSMEEVETIFRSALRDRQIVFFSATIPAAMEEVITRWMSEPERISIQPAQRTAETLEHLYFVCDEREKIDHLRRIVRIYNPKAAIVFVNEINSLAEILNKIRYVGLSIEALHGEADKQERAHVLQSFRDGKFQLLLATDVAARGLDIKGVTHVINLDPPIDSDHYVHRVGRTGRMGRAGTAISIVTAKERFIINKFSKQLAIDISEKDMYQGNIVDASQARPQKKERGAHGTSKMDGKAAPVAERGRQGTSASLEEKRQGVLKSNVAPASAKSGRGASPDTPKRKADRERDRKNKGAPKWLKAKGKQE